MLHMDKAALLIIDLQKGYLRPPELENAVPIIVGRVNQLAAAFAAHNRPIWVIRTVHQPDGSTWTLNMLANSQGYMLAGTPDTELADGLKLPANTHELIKTRDSAFVRTRLDADLQAQNIHTLVLAGITTHSCVAQTAIDAYSYDYHVTIATDAIASHQPDMADSSLDQLEIEYRQKLRLTEDIIASISSSGEV